MAVNIFADFLEHEKKAMSHTQIAGAPIQLLRYYDFLHFVLFCDRINVDMIKVLRVPHLKTSICFNSCFGSYKPRGTFRLSRKTGYHEMPSKAAKRRDLRGKNSR